MTESILKEFRHNRSIVYLALTNTILFSIVGIIYLLGESFLAVPWLSGAILWGLKFYWSKKTPFVQITTQKIVISIAPPLRSPKIVSWDQVSMMQRDSKNGLYLVLRDKRRIKISLFGMLETDRSALISEIEHSIQRTASQAFHADGNAAALHCHR